MTEVRFLPPAAKYLKKLKESSRKNFPAVLDRTAIIWYNLYGNNIAPDITGDFL